MKIILQRVTEAQVTVDKTILGQIKHGYVLFVGVADDDTLDDCAYLVRKIKGLRLFSDSNGRMNNNIVEVNGAILSISQFTLFADTRKGNRPSFSKAGHPEYAKHLYDAFNHQLAATGITVATGEFGADMAVSLVNDGPVTITFDTKSPTN